MHGSELEKLYRGQKIALPTHVVLHIKDGEIHLEEVVVRDGVGLGTTVRYGVNLGRVGKHRDRKKVLSVAIQVGAQGDVEDIRWRFPQIFDRLAIWAVEKKGNNYHRIILPVGYGDQVKSLKKHICDLKVAQTQVSGHKDKVLFCQKADG